MYDAHAYTLQSHKHGYLYFYKHIILKPLPIVMEACIAGVSKCQMANKLHKLAFYEWKKAREKKIYETDKMKKNNNVNCQRTWSDILSMSHQLHNFYVSKRVSAVSLLLLQCHNLLKVTALPCGMRRCLS